MKPNQFYVVTLLTLILNFSQLPLLSQQRDSTFLYSSKSIDVKDENVLIITRPINSEKSIVKLFNGNSWITISHDTIPIIDQSFSKCIFSSFSEKIYVTGKNFLWEYNGSDWKKYSIYDSLFDKRIFNNLIELPDTSLLITSQANFYDYLPGSTRPYWKNHSDLVKFKNGELTIVKSAYRDEHTKQRDAFNMIKKDFNNNYSLLHFHFSFSEIIHYSPNGLELGKYKVPYLSDYGYLLELTDIEDYVFDSKGSLWLSTTNDHASQIVGLIEVRANGEVFFYNENIGIINHPSESKCIEVDKDDNIWFNHTYRTKKNSYGLIEGAPSFYKFHPNRSTFTEYLFEDVLAKSIWYNGGNLTEPLEHYDRFRYIKYNSNSNSLFLNSDIALIQFFPDKEFTSIKVEQVSPIQLYPNPVHIGNTITIESSIFGSNNNPFKIVIRDINGAVIREEIVMSNGHQIQVNTDKLLSGTYYVSVLNDNKIILQTSFVKA